MADNQDPLASLQQLLEDQKSQGGSVPDPEVEQPQPQAEQVEEIPQLTAEEIAVLQKDQQVKDDAKIQEQLDKMKTELKDTPQYQARINQKEVSEADAENKRLEERSKQIFQLKHLDP